MTTFRQLLLGLLILALCSPALAQDEPLLGDESPPPAPPPPTSDTPPPPPSAVTPPPAAQVAPTSPPAPASASAPTAPGQISPRKRKDLTDTDHDMVLKDIGLQIVFITNIGPMIGSSNGSTSAAVTEKTSEAVTDPPSGSGDSQAQMGVRIWFTRNVGMDAGMGMWIGKPAIEDADTQVGFSMYAGVPFALGIYRHVTMFAGPDVGFGFFHMMEDFDSWVFQLKGRAGIELHLGFIDIPRVSLMGTMGLGLRVFNNGDQTELVFSSDQGFSAESLFETSIGLIFYI